jgi:hypothetical protein
MKFIVVSAAVATTLAATSPASAQVVTRDREDVIIRDHEHAGNRHRGGYRDHAECRTMRVRTLLPNGKVVFKTRRTC